MKDVDCPYCGAELEICHDDGFGYSEDELHEMECPECEKYFVFETSIIFSYEARKADCLNGAPHRWVKTVIAPNWWPDAVHCRDCGYQDRGECKRS